MYMYVHVSYGIIMEYLKHILFIALSVAPSFAADDSVLCLQDRVSDFEDGDVHMSSHEHRFRMFSSVEYEGQLYMTPQNFIESVTMSEPRSMFSV